MAFWLMKSEPDEASIDDLVRLGRLPWTGVRNYLARNNMRAMAVGDLGFFYHSNIGREIVGILEIVRSAHPEPGDETGKWECVEVRARADLPRPVGLAEIKATAELAQMSLVTCSRLSVQPVRDEEWRKVCGLAGLDPETLKPERNVPTVRTAAVAGRSGQERRKGTGQTSAGASDRNKANGSRRPGSRAGGGKRTT